MTSYKAYIGEFIGTLLLVFIGVGAAVFGGPAIGTLGVALAFGVTLLVLVYSLGPVSGSHVNPAVTLGMLLARRMTLRDAVGYWIAQIVGGVVGAGIVLAIAKGLPTGYEASVNGLAANGYAEHSPAGFAGASGFFAELIMTFLLVWTVLAATDAKAPAGFAGIAIGLALFLGNLLVMPVTNASINPARSIGPAVFVGGWAMAQLWIFVIAPLFGGLCAAGAYQLLYGRALQAPGAVVTPSDSRDLRQRPAA